jgi:hypothetical protein
MHLISKARALRLSLIALAISQLFSLSASAAQTDAERIAELERKQEKSLSQIEQLSARITQIEGGKVAAPAQSAEISEKVNAQADRLDQVEKNILQVSENAGKRSNLGLPLHGFADIGYAHSSNDPSGRRGGFTMGNLDLYLTPEFGDRV